MRVIDLFAVAACLMVAAVSCEKPGKDQPQNKDPYTLKIMSFNIRNSLAGDTGVNAWSARKAGVKQMVEEQLPDVIGMQEASTAQRNDLKSLLPGYGLLEVPNTGTSKGGNTIIIYNTETVEKIQCKSFYLSSTPNKPSVNGWNDETQYRTTIWAEFRHLQSGRTFFVADTHMPLRSTQAGITARTNSADLNVSRMKEAAGENGTLFIIGDMNCNSASTGLQPYYDWMSSAREKALVTDEVKTFNNYGGSGQSILDHIFYRNAIPSEYKTITKAYTVTYISDHYPIVTKFSVL